MIKENCEFYIEILKQYKEKPTLINEISSVEEAVWLDEALDAAIKALEQEPCEDAISRKSAIEEFQMFREYESNRNNKEWVDRIETVLNQLPSVNPQYTEDDIQKMQNLEQAEIEKAYELGKAEGQKSEDAISRQAAIDGLNSINGTSELDKAFEVIENLPPVNPQPKTGHWIPVNERLPGDRELVLFSTKTDKVFEGRYFDDKTNCQWYTFRGETFAWNNEVIAWMPLPEPYKAEREDKE